MMLRYCNELSDSDKGSIAVVGQKEFPRPKPNRLPTTKKNIGNMQNGIGHFWDYACKAYHLRTGSLGKPLEPTKALKSVTATL